MITPVLKIACDLCGEFRHKIAVSGAPAPIPDRWLEAKNRGLRGPAYCLDGVEIICDTCHKKLAKLKEQIKAEVPKFVKFAEKPTITSNLGGRELYYDGTVWRYSDSGWNVTAKDQLAAREAADRAVREAENQLAIDEKG